MNKKKKVFDRIESKGIPLLIDLEEQCLSTTVAIEQSEKILEMKLQRKGLKA